MFKSITSYTVDGNTTGITINGPGIVSVIESAYGTHKSNNGSYTIIDGVGYLDIDGTEELSNVSGNTYIFKNKIKLYNHNDNTGYPIKVTVGLL